MESRKIQVTGGSSFIVTLPKDWVEDSGLGKNDTVYLAPDSNGNLVISPQESGEHESVKTIDVCDADDREFMLRKLIGAYVAGYSTMVLRCEGGVPAEVSRTIRGFSRTAMGMEIVGEDGESVTVRNLMDPSEVRPRRAVERMRTLAKNLLADTIRAMVNGAGLATLEGRDSDIDRMDWFISRQMRVMQDRPCLYSKLDLTPADMSEIQQVSRIIESIGDHIVTINECTTYMDDPIEIQSLGAVIEDLALPELFSDCVDAFLERDPEKANGCITRCEDTVQRIREVLELGSIMDRDTVTTAALVSSNMKRMLHYFSDISETAIDSAMRR